MTEVLIRKQIEIERKRDDDARLDRINGVEKVVAVLQTVVDAQFKAIWKALDQSVSDENLKALVREQEEKLKESLGELRGYVNSANDRQEENIIGKVHGLLMTQKLELANEQKKMRQQIFFAVFTTGLGVIATLVVAIVLAVMNLG